MRTIITIQHTQSVHHTNGMIGSLTDWELSEKGKRQAQLLGKNLSQELADAPFTVYCSDLQRAVQTAEPLCRYLKTSPIPCKALRERDLGSAVGKSVAWLHEQQREHPDWELWTTAACRTRRPAGNAMKFFTPFIGKPCKRQTAT